MTNSQQPQVITLQSDLIPGRDLGYIEVADVTPRSNRVVTAAKQVTVNGYSTGIEVLG